MALKKHSLLSSKTLQQTPRLSPAENGSKRIRIAASAGAELLPMGTPMAFNSSTNLHQPWTQPSDAAVYTITDQSLASDGGQFTLVIDGLSSMHAWNVTPAAMEAELLALLADAGKGYTVAATCSEANLGVAAAVMTLTFSESAGAPSLDIDDTARTDAGIVEPGNLVLAATDAGTQLNGTDKISGFILEQNPGEEGVQLDAVDDVLGIMLHMGVAYRDDVNTAAIRTILAAYGAPSEAEMDSALRDAELRNKGLSIRGLTQVP